MANDLADTGVCDHSGADLHQFLSREQRRQRFLSLLPNWIASLCLCHLLCAVAVVGGAGAAGRPAAAADF